MRRPPLPRRARRVPCDAALPAGILVMLLAGACSRPAGEAGAPSSAPTTGTSAPAPGSALEVRVAFEAPTGPRSREGSRLEAEVVLSVRPEGALARGGPAAVAEASRDEVRAWLEGALKGGIEAARGARGDDLAPRLAALGITLHAVRVERLGLPGDTARDALRPTTDLRLLLIGLDAYDWDIAEPLMARGRLPVLQSLVRRGARARLQTIPPVLSPVIWTSMATSRKPQDHGILDFLGTDAAGNAVPVTSNLRKVKAFWNVFSDAGLDVGVVGWWATWPAEPVRGVMVSDRVAYQLFDLGDAAPPAVGKVHPPAAWAQFEPLVVKPRDIAPAEVRAFLSPSPAPMDAQDEELLEQFAGILAQARTYAAIGLQVHAERKPRVGAYYFEAPDTACHLFMRYAPPPLPEIDPARQARYARVVDATYEYHDRILGRFVELADEKTVILVVSDHGFRSGAARPSRDSRVETPTAADWHERMGVLVAAGPGIREGVELPEASILDIFPTMLALLGMPVAEDLAGRVLETALTPAFLAEHPVRRGPSFETGEPAANAAFAEASPEDRAILEQLVAIGYVSPAALGSPGGTGPEGGSAPGVAAAGGQAAANAHNNLGTVLLQQGDLDPAETEFREVIRLIPEFVPGHVNLAHVLIRQGRPAEAEAALAAALRLDPANPRALSLLASLHLGSGRMVEAERIARAAVERDPRSAAGWHALGQVLDRKGPPAAAREAYARAAELDPDNPEPHNAIGNSFEAAGAWKEAAEAYERALRVDPTHAAAYNNLALQQQRLGQWDRALATYEEGRRRLPGSSILLNNLATWHHLRAQEALAKARETPRGDPAAAKLRETGLAEAKRAQALYGEATAANALDASPINNLGALFGELGLADEQIRQYRRAVEIDPRYADAWHNIGLWHVDRAQWADAHAAFAKALESSPDAEHALQFDALALLRLGRAAEARRQLEAAVARRPTAGLLATLGTVLLEQGERAEGCRRLREAVQMAPGMADVRQRLVAACGG